MCSQYASCDTREHVKLAREVGNRREAITARAWCGRRAIDTRCTRFLRGVQCGEHRFALGIEVSGTIEREHLWGLLDAFCDEGGVLLGRERLAIFDEEKVGYREWINFFRFHFVILLTRCGLHRDNARRRCFDEIISALRGTMYEVRGSCIVRARRARGQRRSMRESFVYVSCRPPLLHPDASCWGTVR